MKPLLIALLICLGTPVITWGAPVISEFLAGNASLQLDDHDKYSDWIEFGNPDGEALDLSGWHLTDDPENLQRWPFPDGVTVPAGGFLLVYASGLDQTSGPLHANFSLDAAGEFLALVNPEGEIVDSFSDEGYPKQYDDVSYGRSGGETGYLKTATPAAANTGLFGAPPEKVIFSVQGKTFFDAFEVELSHEDSEVDIRYTTDGTEPLNSLFNKSPLYEGPITVDKTTRLAARAFKGNSHRGQATSETYVQLDEDMRDFTSNVPLCIIDSYGQNVDAIGRRPDNGSYLLTPASTIFLDVDPETGRSRPDGEPDYAGSGGMRVRGESSAGFPKKQYAYEPRDAAGNDDNVSILGFPPESDWVIHAPYSDKTLMRNFLSYRWARRMGHYASRVKFMEVFFNSGSDQPVSMSDYRGVYVLMERLTRDGDRIDIQELQPEHDSEPEITGGYIVRKDKEDANHITIRTSREGQTLQLIEPEYTLTDTQQQWITDYFNQFETALHGENFADPTEGYAKYLEVANAVDNHILVEITKNIDGYRLSNYLAKDRLGKLFFIPWDYNLSLGNANYLEGWIPDGWYYRLISQTEYPWYGRLFEDPGFALRYQDRWFELRRGMFSNEALLAEIAELEAYLNESAARNFEKWPRLGIYDWPNPPEFQNRETYPKEVDFMREWLMDRVTWMDSQFEEPVRLSIAGGGVSPGTELELKQAINLFRPRPGTVYYTWDGSDPRLPNGEPNPEAIVYDGPFPLETSGTLRVRLLQTTGVWTALNVASYVVGTPASSANLIVSEIMYNPTAPTAEEEAAGFLNNDDFEFIEVLNTSDETVQLFGVASSNGIVFDFNAAELGTLAPGERGLLVSNRDAFEMRYGGGLPIIGAYISSHLSNGGERLAATDANGDPLFDFSYGDSDPWPADADGEGYSLVLADETSLDADLSSSASWIRSASRNGSPGAAEGPDNGGDDPYTLWLADAFNASELGDESVSGELADPDADGLANLVEFALLTDPRRGDSQSVIEVRQAMRQGREFLQFIFPMNRSADDFEIAVEVSTDLVDWSEDMIEFVNGEPGPTGTDLQIYETIEPVSDEKAMFVRMRVSRP